MATNPYGPDRNIFGRAGRVYRKLIPTGATAEPIGTPLDWIANATEITATMTIDRMEVRRAGSYFVQYKAGEITGEGTLTIDKVNSKFEEEFVSFINGIDPTTGKATTSRTLPVYYLHLTLEDPGQPNIEYDSTTSEATKGQEEIILKNVNFWTMPFGFALNDMVTRDLDFTFTGITFGTDTANKALVITDPTN